MQRREHGNRNSRKRRRRRRSAVMWEAEKKTLGWPQPRKNAWPLLFFHHHFFLSYSSPTRATSAFQAFERLSWRRNVDRPPLPRPEPENSRLIGCFNQEHSFDGADGALQASDIDTMPRRLPLWPTGDADLVDKDIQEGKRKKWQRACKHIL